jgi:hypothetical protein
MPSSHEFLRNPRDHFTLIYEAAMTIYLKKIATFTTEHRDLGILNHVIWESSVAVATAAFNVLAQKLPGREQ